MSVTRQIVNAWRQSRAVMRSEGPLAREALLTTVWGLQFKSLMGGRNGNRSRKASVAGMDVEYFDRAALALLFDEVFVRQEYKFSSTKPAPLIIDAGSNIGLAILYFKRLYPGAQVLGFEPDPVTFSVLQHNVQANALSNVRLHQAALGNATANITLYTNSTCHGAPYASTHPQIVEMCAGPDNLSSVSVPQICLSTQIDGPVDFLKLDIEGGEIAVFEDLARSGKISQIRELVMEFHHHIRASEDHCAHLLGVLEANGFGYYIMSSPQRPAGYGGYQNLMIHAYQREAFLGSPRK